MYGDCLSGLGWVVTLAKAGVQIHYVFVCRCGFPGSLPGSFASCVDLAKWDGGGPVGRSTMRQVDRQVYITELRASKVRCSEPITQHATSFPSKSES